MASRSSGPATTQTQGTGSSALGERVRTARRDLGLSQAQLAGEELTKGFISQLEAGLVRPSIRSLQVIASRLGKPLDYFLGDETLAAGKRAAFHLLAADAAAARSDWPEVRRNAGIALEHAPDGRDRAYAIHLVVRAENAARQFEKAFELIADGLGMIAPSDDPGLVADLLYARGFAYSELGQLVAATEAFESCKDIIDRYEVIEPRLRARVMVALGTMYRRLNRTAKAISSYESGLAIASRSSELALAARGYMGIAASLYDSGDLDAAIRTYRRALELFQRAADISFELNAMQSIAIVQFEAGDVANAKRSAERTMGRALEVGERHWAAVAEVILARVALSEGRTQDALKMARHAEQALRESGDRIQQADALGATGAAYEALGRTGDADKAYRRSIDLYTSIGDFADRSGMAAEYARLLRARGEVDAAFEMLELARGTGARS